MATITLELDVNTKEGLDALKDLSNKAKVSAKKMQESARVASNAWSTFKGVLGANVVSGAFVQMQHAAGMFFDSVVDNTILMETLTTEMTTMTGSAEKAAEVMQDLQDFSATTPFQLEGIARAAKQLIAFGFEVDSITDKMKIIGDVAAGSGAQLSDVALIYGQVAAAGKLTGERLLQFQERAIPIGPAIAKTMGIAEEAVKDMVSKGKVDLDTFERSFKTLTEEGGLFFDSMIDKSETTAGVISTLKDNFALLAADIGKNFLPQFKIIAKELTTFIAKNREGIVEGFGAGFTKSVKMMLKILPELIKGLKLAFITTVNIAEISLRGLEGAIDAVGLGMATLARLALATYVGYLKLASVASEVANAFSMGLTGGTTVGDEEELEKALESWREMVAVQEEFTKSLADNGEKNKKSLNELWDAFTGEEQTTELDKTFSSLIKKLDMVGVKVKEISKDKLINIDATGKVDGSIFNWKAIKESFTNTFTEVSEAVSKFWKENVSEGTSKGLAGFAKDFSKILKSGMKTQRANMDALAKNQKEIDLAIMHGNEEEAAKLRLERAELEKQAEMDKNQAAVQTFQAGITAVGASFGPWGDAAAAVVNTFLEFAQDPEALVGLIDGIVDALPVIIDALVEAMPIVAEGLAENMVPIWAAIAEGIWKLFLKLPEIFISAVSGFIEGVKEVIAEMFASLTRITLSFDGIAGIFNVLIDEFPKALLEGASNFVNQIVEEIKGALPKISLGGGGDGKGPITGIPGSPLATGGIIPKGFPNDTFPARLSSGEEVVSTNDRKTILEDQAMIKNMLSSLLQSSGQPVVVNTELRLNEQAFADIILELDRDNKRIAL